MIVSSLDKCVGEQDLPLPVLVAYNPPSSDSFGLGSASTLHYNIAKVITGLMKSAMIIEQDIKENSQVMYSVSKIGKNSFCFLPSEYSQS